MPDVGQTVTIINQSGKIVGTTKTLVNVFREARSAYVERKTELKIKRQRQGETKQKEQLIGVALGELTLESGSRLVAQDDISSALRDSHDKSLRGKKTRTNGETSNISPRPSVGRALTDTPYVEHSKVVRTSQSRVEATRTDFPKLLDKRLSRRHTDDFSERSPPRRAIAVRHPSLDHIDMDLAYGEMPLLPPENENKDVEIELQTKMTTLQHLLDECNCIQHSVTATIDNLQKNPDALAAVALTLAEISALATKLAPGTLASLKGAFPVVLALLASPQFAIAAGVGVGVTIIALGGYKIIKKIRTKSAIEAGGNLLTSPSHIDGGDGADNAQDDGEDELRELNKIERWRRGIADAEAGSIGTSVDGEFITPHATRTLIEEGRLRESDLKSRTSTTRRRRKKPKSDSASKHNKEKSESSRSGTKTKSKKERGGISMLFKRNKSDEYAKAH